jgi:PadR family transcriptional regulator, regulatory protein PadR
MTLRPLRLTMRRLRSGKVKVRVKEGLPRTSRWRSGCWTRAVQTLVQYLRRIRCMRKTHALVQVAMALLDDPTGRHWGYELSRRTGVRSGVLYPILTRMLNEGWVEDGWEDPTTIREKRPPRRYYELTDKGRLALGAVRQEARSDTRFTALVRRFA